MSSDTQSLVQLAYRLAAQAGICLASAKKAIKLGPYSLRGQPGERAAEAMQRLGIVPLCDAESARLANCGRPAATPAPTTTTEKQTA